MRATYQPFVLHALQAAQQEYGHQLLSVSSSQQLVGRSPRVLVIQQRSSRNDSNADYNKFILCGIKLCVGLVRTFACGEFAAVCSRCRVLGTVLQKHPSQNERGSRSSTCCWQTTRLYILLTVLSVGCTGGSLMIFLRRIMCWPTPWR